MVTRGVGQGNCLLHVGFLVLQATCQILGLLTVFSNPSAHSGSLTHQNSNFIWLFNNVLWLSQGLRPSQWLWDLQVDDAGVPQILHYMTTSQTQFPTNPSYF